MNYNILFGPVLHKCFNASEILSNEWDTFMSMGYKLIWCRKNYTPSINPHIIFSNPINFFKNFYSFSNPILVLLRKIYVNTYLPERTNNKYKVCAI